MKVLDFGLAKMIDGPAKAGYDGGGFDDGRSVRLQPDLTMSPTITTPAMTQLGMILGTAAYMAPEQARSKPVDKRSDIWAFGCVLFEMLTGRQAFDGEDVTDTIAAVVRAAMASRREGTLLRGSRGHRGGRRLRRWGSILRWSGSHPVPGECQWRPAAAMGRRS